MGAARQPSTVKVEGWRHGRKRGAAAQGGGRREPRAEALVADLSLNQEVLKAVIGKKRVEFASLGRDVAFASAEFRLSERVGTR